ncbi:MAG: helix-turn-helix domain-containing protein [Treponema sp.]|nr:helix-turn-helix domain-containing protein [Treponema sp.]MCL2251641.1 helix-turn-helix domain-containing protein [Treponema sp.]
MDLERFVIDNIKRIRKDKGFSQEKLAEACNTATSYIGLMEIYKNVPKLSTIERIAKALGVSPLIFFQDKNNAAEQLPPEQEIELQNKKRAILQFLEKEIDNILHNR